MLSLARDLAARASHLVARPPAPPPAAVAEPSPVSALERAARAAIPLAWAAASRDQTYLNLGDALSAVMVTVVSGRKVVHAHARSSAPRLAAVGTIAHGLSGGEAWIWGTGCSAWRNPLSRDGEREPYSPPADTKLHVLATRGPLSWQWLTGAPPGPEAVFGDPVWLLPRYFQPTRPKEAELGAILHLAELEDRATVPHPKSPRYNVPSSLAGWVQLINTVTDISADALRQRLEDILACRRLVSTSLHGLVFAESYGIPCLYFTALPGPAGLRHIRLGLQDGLNSRMSDLYLGLGVETLPVYNQPKNQPTDWPAVIAAIDSAWRPKRLDEAALLAAFPLARQPLAPASGDLFAHPLVQSLPFKPGAR